MYTLYPLYHKSKRDEGIGELSPGLSLIELTDGPRVRLAPEPALLHTPSQLTATGRPRRERR
jgi:hypothetical protein